MEEQLDRSLATEHLVAVLALLFGAVAALLTAIGLYGILSQDVARRTRELGLRMALGAHARRVTWLLAREVLILCAIGAVVAVPVALALGRLVETHLYGIAPTDPGSVAGPTVLLVLIAALVTVVPARRATGIAPTEALRYE